MLQEDTMYSEQLALMLLMAAVQSTNPHAKVPSAPVVEDGRQAMIRAVKEPELVAALSLRAKRLEMRKQNTVIGQTMLASAD
jgi:hypothetical protein